MRINVVCLRDPAGPPDGGVLRVRALLRAFADLGHTAEPVFPGGDADGPMIAATRGTRLPARAAEVKRSFLPLPTQLGGRSHELARRLEESAPDLVVIGHLSMLANVGDALPARRWMDFYDLWSDFGRGEAEHRSGLRRRTTLLQAAFNQRAETRSAMEAHTVSCAGWKDAASLAARTGRPVRWLPNPVEIPERPPRPAERTAGMIGNFDYWPNRDAYDVLVRAWLPALRSQGWRVVIAGTASESLDSHDDVTLLGPIGDVSEFYSGIALALAPVRLGGGMKMKVAEALVHGRNVLASPSAVEGFPPSVRARVQLAEVDDTQLPALDASPAAKQPPEWLLDMFRQETFTATVGSMLE